MHTSLYRHKIAVKTELGPTTRPSTPIGHITRLACPSVCSSVSLLRSRNSKTEGVEKRKLLPTFIARARVTNSMPHFFNILAGSHWRPLSRKYEGAASPVSNGLTPMLYLSLQPSKYSLLIASAVVSAYIVWESLDNRYNGGLQPEIAIWPIKWEIMIGLRDLRRLKYRERLNELEIWLFDEGRNRAGFMEVFKIRAIFSSLHLRFFSSLTITQQADIRPFLWTIQKQRLRKCKRV